MKTSVLALLCAALLMMIIPTCAEENQAGALTLEELEAWAGSYLERAKGAETLNDPHDEEALTEDGYAYIYDFATLYLDRPDLTDEAVLNAVVINDSEEKGPRGTAPDQQATDVLNAFYMENDNLEGDHGFAALYISDTMPSGALWAWVQRDGQRLMTIQYAVHEQLATGGDGYTDSGLVYTIQDGLVAAIRAYGLNSRISGADVEDNLREVGEVQKLTGYISYPSSLDGSKLARFGENDLSFAGISFLTVTPEEAEATFGPAEADDWMQDDDGAYLRTMTFPGCVMQFTYNAKKANPRPYLFEVNVDSYEGPRGVRYGDTVASVIARFRSGEGEVDESGMTEMFYGEADSREYGMGEYYDDASATLRYVTPTEDGGAMMLYLSFDMMELTSYTVSRVD